MENTFELGFEKEGEIGESLWFRWAYNIGLELSLNTQSESLSLFIVDLETRVTKLPAYK